MRETPIEWARIEERMTNKIIKKDEDDWELIISKTKHIENEDAEQYAQKIGRLCKRMNPNISQDVIISKVQICHDLAPNIRKEIHHAIETTEKLSNKFRKISKGIMIIIATLHCTV